MDIEVVQFVELCKGIFADSSFIDDFNERLERCFEWRLDRILTLHHLKNHGIKMMASLRPQNVIRCSSPQSARHLNRMATPLGSGFE
jgi:hypothetical protein